MGGQAADEGHVRLCVLVAYWINVAQACGPSPHLFIYFFVPVRTTWCSLCHAMGALFTTTTPARVTDTDESRNADVEGAEEFRVRVKTVWLPRRNHFQRRT